MQRPPLCTSVLFMGGHVIKSRLSSVKRASATLSRSITVLAYSTGTGQVRRPGNRMGTLMLLLPPRIAIALFACLAAAAPAGADVTLEARYTVSFTGITLGQGALVAELNEEGYSAAGSAMVAGILQAVTGGKGTAAARGQFAEGRVLPLSYSGHSESNERSQEVRLAGAGGAIDEVFVQPRRPAYGDRVPLRDEHRKDVVDPMSALLMPVSGDGDLTGADACRRTLPIFDGEYRYDLIFTFERSDTAKDVKGYAGPVVVCRVEYRPIAGHRANRRQVRELRENRKIFVWLAPIAGTRVVTPVRVSFGSRIGEFIMQATHFAARPSAHAGTPSR